MDFQKRLEKAVERGRRVSQARAQAQAELALTEEELKRLHSQHRLEFSEHIEACLQQLANQFPGFRYELVVGERGWGAAISRDDLSLGGRKRSNFFSRLDMTIRPFSQSHVVELASKATVRNKEIFNRSQYQPLGKADPKSFHELIDLWALEYAEAYAAGD